MLVIEAHFSLTEVSKAFTSEGPHLSTLVKGGGGGGRGCGGGGGNLVKSAGEDRVQYSARCANFLL